MKKGGQSQLRSWRGTVDRAASNDVSASLVVQRARTSIVLLPLGLNDMTSSDIPASDLTPEFPRADARAAPAELGDVVDSIEDAAVTLGRVVTNEVEDIVDDVRYMIHEQPIAAVAIVGAVGYLLGRFMR